ncbi:MAG TPA: nicotinate (nicotinamide) nucleotide adenylyltransferase [Tepidisphaeraceae bacterium]|jgi:nicotinate-nucleotide adenylyltransferase
MSLLCFGGSFNPIHYGHLRTSQTVAERLQFSKVLLIPSAQPPHKPLSADLAAPAHRLRMCQLATQELPLFEVSDIELQRSGPSYTLDTARQLHALGIKKVDWLIGADMLRILPSWHQAQTLIREVNFIIIARPGWSFDWQQLPQEFQFLKEHVVEAPMIDISATQIRQRIGAGEPIDDLTPPAVARYIQEQKLYQIAVA